METEDGNGTGRFLLKKIQTRRGCYVYDTWTNAILQVDGAVFQLLPDGFPQLEMMESALQDERERNRVLKEIEEARRAGYLRTGFPRISNFPPEARTESVERLLEKGPDHLILNITERCNLRCRYCSFSGAYEDNRTHSDEVMSEAVLERALDWYLGHRREDFSIGFYGGEPLLDFSLMRKAVHHAMTRTTKPVTFRLTTNGTLLSRAACRFLIDHDIRLVISVDGPQDVHDRYRVFSDGRGSFAAMWEGLERLRAMAPDYFHRRVAFNVVAASPVKLLRIQEFMDEHPEVFHDHLITTSRVNPYPSCLPSTLADREGDGRFPEQKEVLYRMFRRKMLNGAVYPEDFPVSLFKSDFVDLHQRSMTPMPEVVASDGQCVPGDPKCFVATRGDLYMCERVGNTRPIGSVRTGFDTAAILKFLEEYDEFFREECSRCWAVRLCSKCFVTVRNGEDFSRERLRDFCRSNLRRWSWVLEKYCEIREEKADAFAWCRDAA